MAKNLKEPVVTYVIAQLRCGLNEFGAHNCCVNDEQQVRLEILTYFGKNFEFGMPELGRLESRFLEDEKIKPTKLHSKQL